MMKLRKKLSGVLAPKKPEPVVPSPASSGGPLTPITESDADEHALRSQILSASAEAIINAMTHQQAVLEEDVASKDAEIARLRQQVLRDEGQRMQREAVLGLNAQRVLQLQEDMAHIRLENEELKRRHDSEVAQHMAKAQQHQAAIWEYEDRIWRQDQENEERFAREHDIEAPAHIGRVEAEIMAAVQSQMDAVAEVVANNERLGAQVTALENDLLVANQTLDSQQALYASAMRSQEASMEDIEWTPRAILALAIAASDHETTMPNNDRPEVALFMHDLTIDTLTNQSLDVRLTPGQACQLAASIDTDNLTLLTCDLCHRPKIMRKDGTPASTRRINEFPSRAQPTSCCSKNICSTCYLEGVKTSLANNWWDKLDQINWIVCPAPGCEADVLGRGRSSRTPERLLRELGEGNIYAQMDAYNRALELRNALRDLSLDEEALELAWRLHFTLISSRKMHSPLDLTIAMGEIKMIRVDQNGQSVRIPLFANFLRRQTPERAKECAFCTEEIQDIDIDGSEDWLDVCSGFYGDWVWQMLLFPIKMGVGCRHEIGFCSRNVDSCNGGVEYCQHEIDFCTGCLQRHLETQLEQHGRSGTNRLTCPSADCGRVLGHNEIKLYAKEETFQTYDKYLNLNVLSQDPTFRWCLGQGCSSGALYDDSEGPKVQCRECRFQMCFQHSVAWHDDQTCAQYDSVKAHGDPDYQKTTDWIKKNTKPCPKCRRNIQKGEMCFHMTCSQCMHEFCWECLADWANIGLGLGQYNVNAHRTGCPFRTNGIAPTHISGETYAAAMQQRRV